MIAVGASNTSNSTATSCFSSGIALTSCPWYIAAGVITAVICLLGIPANITVIVKLSPHLHGSSISRRLFFTLAVSDLLCLLCLPIGVFVFTYGAHVSHGLCRFLTYFFIFCITSDLNTLVLISIQRYYQLLHPQKWAKLGRTWQRVLLLTVWMLGALLALPVVFSLTELEHHDEQSERTSCKNQRIAPPVEVFYILFIIFSNLVLLTFYVLLVKGVRRTQMRNMKQPKATRLFIRIIAVSLLVSFSPLILRVVHVVAHLMKLEELHYVSEKLTFVEYIYFFNHCLNPFLYFFASRHQPSDRKGKGLLNDA